MRSDRTLAVVPTRATHPITVGARFDHGGVAMADIQDGSDGIVVVTGASAGIDRDPAVAFAEAGFDVALLARGRAGLEAAADEVRSHARRALRSRPTWPTSTRSVLPQPAD